MPIELKHLLAKSWTHKKDIAGNIKLAILAAGLGIISMWIGFRRKSVPVTIVSAVILCSLISNIGMSIFLIIAAFIAAAVSTMAIIELLSKINRMEV